MSRAPRDAIVRRASELPGGIEELVRESRAEGFQFVERLCREWKRGDNRFDRPGEALFAAHVGPVLAGVCGLNQDPFSSQASCGRLRRLYVLPSMRRRGIARSLTRAAIAVSPDAFSVVRLRTDNAEAAAFYLALGFSAVSSDPHVTHELRVG